MATVFFYGTCRVYTFSSYKKNIGRSVEVVLTNGLKVIGKMMEITDTDVIVEETKGKNKKKEVLLHNFPFDQIKSTKIQTIF